MRKKKGDGDGSLYILAGWRTLLIKITRLYRFEKINLQLQV
jgi:hypothetical protein